MHSEDDSVRRLLMGGKNGMNPFQYNAVNMSGGLSQNAIQLDVENILSPLNKLATITSENHLNESADILNEM